MSQRTESEFLFESACDGLGVEYSRIPEQTTRTPDYKIVLNGQVAFAEVKQFEDNPAEKAMLAEARKKGAGAWWPGTDERIRYAIKEANQQLKPFAKENPSILILHTQTSISGHDSQDIHDAMFGSETYTFADPTDRVGYPLYLGVSLANDGRMKPERHTSTSAVVSLSKEGERTYLTFYHNKFAKVPFDPNWLRADRVKHFASQDSPEKQIPGWAPI